MNFWIEGKRAELLRLLDAGRHAAAQRRGGAAALGRGQPAGGGAGHPRAWGRSAVVIKRGDAGALLFHEGGVFAAPAFPIEDVVDPTGAGDSFAGGFMGWLAREGDISPATHPHRDDPRLGAGVVLPSRTSASTASAAWTSPQIRERFAAFADLVHFEKIKL